MVVSEQMRWQTSDQIAIPRSERILMSPQAVLIDNQSLAHAREGMRVLCFDESVRQSPLPPGFRWSRTERAADGEMPPVAAVLRDAADFDRLKSTLPPSWAAAILLVGLSESLRAVADQIVCPTTPTIAGTLLTLEQSVHRAARLPRMFADMKDGPVYLLAHLAVRDIGLDPLYDTACRSIFRLGASERLGKDVESAAEQLVGWRYLKSSFFDKINICPSCTSARILLREECPACRSANVRDENIIHHFRCATQAPEGHFRQGQDLVCPKCRQYLNHFSVDYDKPGVTLVCRECGHQTSDPVIGFRCLDCNAHDDAKRLVARTVKSYALTEEGRAAAFDPVVLARLDSRPLQVIEELAGTLINKAVIGEPPENGERQESDVHAKILPLPHRSPLRKDRRSIKLVGRLAREHCPLRHSCKNDDGSR